MNSTKTVIMAMIVAFAMIGMTGLAMAGSTTQTYVGDGTYTTSWNGNGGTMDIYTSTSNGQDHLSVDYQNGRSTGTQTGETDGWTKITRDVSTRGRDTSLSATSIDNSGDLIDIDAAATSHYYRYGRCSYAGTHLNQAVFMNDVPDYDAVVSVHGVSAYGSTYDVSVVALAGYDDQGTRRPRDDTWSAATAVELDGMGYAGIYGVAGVVSNDNGAASGQAFYAYAWGPGVADITSQGDDAGIGSFRYDDGMRVRNDRTVYYSDTFYNPAGTWTYINLHDNHNWYYSASGYIYAVSTHVS